MDPLSLVISSGWASELAETAAKEIWRRFTQAKQDYEERPIDPTSKLEADRQNLVHRLCDLQSQVMTISHPGVIRSTVPVLLQQMVEVYAAKDQQGLEYVHLMLARVEGILKQYGKILRQRAIARWLAVGVTLLALAGLIVVLELGTKKGGPSVDTVLPIIMIPLPVLVWSAIGSFAAILYRFNSSGDAELQDPLRWLFTRPLTGIVMGTITYFILRVGLMSVESPSVDKLSSSELLWLVAFLSGFSDRFSDTLLRSLIGRFSGEKPDSLVTLSKNEAPARFPLLEALRSVGGFGVGDEQADSTTDPKGARRRGPLKKSQREHDDTPLGNSLEGTEAT